MSSSPAAPSPSSRLGAAVRHRSRFPGSRNVYFFGGFASKLLTPGLGTGGRGGSPLRRRPRRGFHVSCESKTEEKLIRRFPPYLEGALLTSVGEPASNEWKSIPDLWRDSAEKYGDRIALVDPYHDPPTNMTYQQLEQGILEFSEGLRVIGVKPDEKLAFFADNSSRWLVADQGMMATGAINVVRGSRSSTEELMRIYQHSESVGLTIDSPDLFNRIAKVFFKEAAMRFVIVLWGDKSNLSMEQNEEIPVYTYHEILNLGRESRKTFLASKDTWESYQYQAIDTDDVAAIIYTSGTTGDPKGVMLTHRNLLHQINHFSDIVPAIPGDRFLSILPPWHIYERACEYFIFTNGIEQMYTSVKYLKEDLRRYQPHYLLAVPLIYDTLYSAIQKQISSSSAARRLVALAFIKISMTFMECKRIYEGNYVTRDRKQPWFLLSLLYFFWARSIAAILWPLHMIAKKVVYSKIRSAIGISKAGISGGGSLPFYVDQFFEAIGVMIQNGYGMTECSPVIAARLPGSNVIGTCGHPLRYTEVKIVDPETNEVLPHGSKGIIKVKGPQVMKGYFKNPAATSRTLDKDGWLDTGDIGFIIPEHSLGRSRHCGGMIVPEGRAKDTIVLSTGENVEPAELEEAALRSSLIQQIVVVGQDKRRLGAIIVPNSEEILLAAKRNSLIDADASEVSLETAKNLLREELTTWTSECPFQVGPFLVLDEPFTIEGGFMTPTLKIRRDRVVAEFKEQIDKLYN
ncbi:hypothetical protein MLD38_018791 [Melastoma candidum]|uniref:Uncharacterized protein n=1 Tax=Melastoma candidum TaxID=119954 RepID=A0ACB9QUB7_9MYRT|nr:hypothetical protein MLD38_018791 [Melastoma candidum]